MSRLEFDKVMKNRYGLKSVRTGTFEDQAFGNLKRADWTSWDPGTASPTYAWIVEAFASIEKTFGGTPAVEEIAFFANEYEKNDQGDAVKVSDVGASYSAGRLVIYQSVVQSNMMFNLQKELERPAPEQATKRNITHELGHGIAETALTQGSDKPPGADPDLFKEYRAEVGWSDDDKLYDIQEPAVQSALAKKATPPAEFRITPNNVATHDWKERPLTSYMATNAAEDFAEAIMAYVNEPERLKVLSPARFRFIEKHKARWIASGQPKKNIWEQAKDGSSPARVLKPSRPSTIWDRIEP
ncbi:MAG: hypothetical protein M3Y86_07785 [Verrucomicrobiota bacterium]|nr:hypothetical protein [Verrucomicrobiota bacterium]